MKRSNFFGHCIFVFLIIVMLNFTAGCTETDSTDISDISSNTPVATTTPEPQTQEHTSAEKAPTETTTKTESKKDSPKYHAGMIASDNKGNLKLVTAYDKDREKYTTRTLLKGDKGNKDEAYLSKDGSFKELGITFDDYKIFDSKYPYEFDDLNLNSDTEIYYNYEEKSGNRIYIYTTGAIPKYVGYLIPDSLESMDFVNTNV